MVKSLLNWPFFAPTSKSTTCILRQCPKTLQKHSRFYHKQHWHSADTSWWISFPRTLHRRTCQLRAQRRPRICIWVHQRVAYAPKVASEQPVHLPKAQLFYNQGENDRLWGFWWFSRVFPKSCWSEWKVCGVAGLQTQSNKIAFNIHIPINPANLLKVLGIRVCGLISMRTDFWVWTYTRSLPALFSGESNNVSKHYESALNYDETWWVISGRISVASRPCFFNKWLWSSQFNSW